MMQMVTALGTVVNHLVKALSEQNGVSSHLEKEKALEFMSNVYKDSQSSSLEILRKIGVQNVSESQLHCLEDLPLTATYDCLQLFVHWIEAGFYDFCTVPIQFKAHMNPEDKNSLDQLRTSWSGTIHELKQQLHELVDALKHCEGDITTKVNENINVSAYDL